MLQFLFLLEQVFNWQHFGNKMFALEKQEKVKKRLGIIKEMSTMFLIIYFITQFITHIFSL